MHNRNLLFVSIWVLFVWAGTVPALAAPRMDAAFGLNGRVAVELGVKNSGHAVVVQVDGKIVVAGSSSKGADLNFSLLRFNRDGSLDTTFNGDGSVITPVSTGDDEALALGLLADGRIVAAGYSHNGTDRDFALVCYLPDGSRDLAFGSNGGIVAPIGSGNEEITAITINAEDMITVAGTSEGTVGRVLVTARFSADGSWDSSYGDRGVSIVGVGEDAAAEGIVERKDGSLVLSGSYVEKKNSSLMLVGLDAYGFLDYSFGSKGITTASPSFAASEGYGLAEDVDGSLYLAGSVGVAGNRDTALFRFTRDGKVDTSFGNRGLVINRVSEEDDLLYAVSVGKNGVVASGYTTDGGTRQFLLVTLSQESNLSLTENAKRPGIPTIHNDAAKTAPIQEVRVNGSTRMQVRRLRMLSSFSEVNGSTKMQIRRLQMSSSFSDYVTGSNAPAHPPPRESAAVATEQARTMHLSVDGNNASLAPWVSAAIREFGAFLLPSAVAASSRPATATAAPVSSHVITTTFSEGGAVGYAATIDASGTIIVAGTAEGAEASSIVVAQYTDAAATDSITDQPGASNSHIATTPSADVTKTTAVIVGEIAPSFGMTVARRGVVFSITRDPVYSGMSGSDSTGPTAAGFFPLRMFGDLTNLLVADAVAAPTDSSADAHFSREGETANGSGYGTFTARLERLKPGTAYFVRTYALTPEGAVYYGNQLSFRTADACFVATATFGTLLHPGVAVLRDFRDTFLVNTAGGQLLVDLYYTLSPPVADSIARSGLLRFAVRLILLPFIGFSWLAMQGGMVLALFTLVGSVTIFAWLSARIFMRR